MSQLCGLWDAVEPYESLWRRVDRDYVCFRAQTSTRSRKTVRLGAYESRPVGQTGGRIGSYTVKAVCFGGIGWDANDEESAEGCALSASEDSCAADDADVHIGEKC